MLYTARSLLLTAAIAIVEIFPSAYHHASKRCSLDGLRVEAPADVTGAKSLDDPSTLGCFAVTPRLSVS
jgi:hypothetical protein